MEKIIAEPIQKIIDEFKKLPWIWEKTAQKLAFYVVKKDKKFSEEFWKNFFDLKKNIRECEKCCNYTENIFCNLCEKKNRDEKILCVVENPFDIFPIEKSWVFNWFYHILHWVISPIDWVFAENLRIEKLLNRIKNSIWNENISEIILAINPSLEGEATSIYIWRKIEEIKNELWVDIKITTLAKWISVWWDLEYTDELTIKKSLENRINFFI